MYGEDPESVGKTISLAIGAGAIGCNLEDSIASIGELREAGDQVSRLRSAREVANAAKIDFFINARCDVFFQGPADKHNKALAKKAIERAHIYAEAGADGLFLPGLSEIQFIAQIAKQSPIPLNILVNGPSPSVSLLSENGVARVSYGGTPYAETIEAFEEAARKAYS